MTVIEKLSDRNNLIFNAIKLILVNSKNTEKEGLNAKELQWKLFECGIYIDGNKLKQALSVMDEKGLLTKPKTKIKTGNGEVNTEIKEPSTPIPDEVLQQQESETGIQPKTS